MQKILSSNINVFHFFLVLTLLFYGNSLKNGFSLDDSYVTVTNMPVKGNEKNYKPNNELIAKGIGGIPKIWRSHYGHGKGTNYDYRPLTLTMFAIEYSLWGQAPHIEHFVNLVFYTLVVFYFFLFLKRLLQHYTYNQLFALICGVLFLAHPIHTEVVNNIKCRDELLALLFVILSFNQFLLYNENKKNVHIVYLFSFIALSFFSKISAILVFVLIPLIAFFFTKVSKKQITYVITGFVFFFILYRKMRNFMLIGEEEVRLRYHFENPLYSEHLSFLQLIPYALKSFGIYTKLLFFPYPLRYYYGYPLQTAQQSLFDFEIIIGIIFLVLAIWYCYKKQDKIAFFGLLFYLLSVAPLTNIVRPMDGIVGERLCFTGSIGFVIFMVAVLFSLFKTIPSKITLQSFTQKPLLYLSIVLVVFLLRDWTRNSNWESEFSLYEHDQQYEPKSAGGSNMLGNKYYEMLNTGSNQYPKQVFVNKIFECYQYAYSTDSTLFSAFNNAGALVFSYMGKYDQAFQLFNLGIKHNPKPYPQAYENLGNYYRVKNNFKEAYINYRIATLQNHHQYNSYKLLLEMLFKKQNYAAAEPIVKEALLYFPNDYLFMANYGNSLLMQKDTIQGIQQLENAFTIFPNKKLAEFLFGKLLLMKDSTKAEYYRTQYSSLP